MAKKKENADLLQLGQKARAGALLSGYLRAIGTENTEVVIDDVPLGCPPGMPKLVSKAEALARHIWRKALRHKDDEGVTHEPDLNYVRIVLERIEGKAGTMAEEKGETRETVPEKVSRLGVERLNRLAEGE
jgi:hypothetical protein